jgi:fatty acid desaturase
MQLSPRSYYVHSLSETLPASVFGPARSRLWWLPTQLAIVAAGIFAIAHTTRWPLQLLASLPIGCAFGGLAFLAHETLHGAVVRGRWARAVVGAIGFAPFLLSTALWMRWHGAAHHGNAQRDAVDPDAYPMLELYRRSRAVRFMIDRFSMGGRRWTGVFSLVLGFSIQSAKLLLRGGGEAPLGRGELARAWAGTAAAIAGWATIAWLLGAQGFVFAYGVPLLIGNALVMAHILTNHGLCPLTEINDPLANSLTVTVPPWLRFLTMGFGFHVEHHLFPAMSARHAERVRRELQQRWPQRYRSMPMLTALRLLHHTARVYEDATTLCDPRSGQRWDIAGLECRPLPPMA